MKKICVFGVIVTMCTMVFLATGCGSGASKSKKTEIKYKDTLNVAYNAQSSTFDPMVTGATATAEIGRLVFESLFEMDKNGDPKGQLCESYTKSDDNKN